MTARLPRTFLLHRLGRLRGAGCGTLRHARADDGSRRLPVAKITVGIGQSGDEFTFRQLKDPHIASCSPMFH